ncbi:MAG TPA: STAS domain-containing protein [Geobacterales bacterium]|jgi:anti-anti-sigma factor|nr:STAS domain-containing protein [Geobacterales bacterium]
MRLETYKSNNKFEAEISDKLTSSDLSNFRELLSAIKQSTCKVIVLDLSNLDWIDSAGLGMLILAKELAEKEELELVLRSPRGHVKSLLELGRFEKIFSIEA